MVLDLFYKMDILTVLRFLVNLYDKEYILPARVPVPQLNLPARERAIFFRNNLRKRLLEVKILMKNTNSTFNILESTSMWSILR